MRAPSRRRLDARDRRILALGLPALATVLVEPLYTVVDTAIVGHLGTAPLGGLALASTVLTTSFWVFNFLAFGTTSRVAFLTGRKDDRGASAVATQGFWLCGCIGIPVALALTLAARPIGAAMGGHGDVLRAAVTYLRISAVGTPFILVSLVGNGYLRGVSDTRTPLRVVAVANAVNLVLEVGLVYGLNLGVAGSAWGTVAAQVMAAVWFAVLVGRRVTVTGARLRPVGREMRRLVVVGRHLFVRTGALLTTLALATSIAARLGAVTLAAHQIALQIWLLLALAFDGLAIPAQTITGTLLGEGSRDDSRAYGRRLCILGLWSGAAVAVLIVMLSRLLPNVFTSDSKVAHQATVALVAVGILQVPGAVLFVLDGILMGASDFRFLQLSTVSALIGFLPVGGAVLAWHRLGIAGLWFGLAVWIMVRLTINTLRYRGTAWSSVATSG